MGRPAEPRPLFLSTRGIGGAWRRGSGCGATPSLTLAGRAWARCSARRARALPTSRAASCGDGMGALATRWRGHRSQRRWIGVAVARVAWTRATWRAAGCSWPSHSSGSLRARAPSTTAPTATGSRAWPSCAWRCRCQPARHGRGRRAPTTSTRTRTATTWSTSGRRRTASRAAASTSARFARER
eukprot:4519848-Prymnesium_polylepis.1